MPSPTSCEENPPEVDKTTTGAGTVYLDTVTVELTTGADLLARPYCHSVSGRHMMLSQGGTLWKATRSTREKKFYSLIRAATTQHRDCVRPVPTTVGESTGSPSSPLRSVAEGERSVYAAAALALQPFLARYYGTRDVAYLKVGSIGFREGEDSESGGGGAPWMSASSHSVATTTTTTATATASPAAGLAEMPGAGGSPSAIPSAPRTPCRSPLQGSFSGQPTPMNASRVVLQTDAVKSAVAQFAREKRDATAEWRGQAGVGEEDTWPGGGHAGDGSTSPTRHDVVAVATAQIEHELNRRLPPRHADHRGTTSTTDPTGGRATLATGGHSSGKAAAAPAPGTGPSDGWVEMIVLEDVCCGFQWPCVLDVKMGTRQYGMGTKPDKVREKEHKAHISTSAAYGIRLAGFKRWSASQQVYEVRTKHDLLTLSFDDVAATLRYFLSSYQPPEPATGPVSAAPRSGGEADPLTEAEHTKLVVSAAVRQKLTEQLTRLLAAFRAQGVFRFFTSSLLIVYDAADPVRTCRAVMVDFAYAYEWRELVAAGDPQGGESVDEGYICGIESLLKALQDPHC